MRRLTIRGISSVVSTLVVLTLTVVAAQPASAAGCANEAIRAEQGRAGLALPECRAYELVSPGGVPLVGGSGSVTTGVRAADDGSAMAYFSYYPFPGSPSSGRFVRARRGPSGWTLEAMMPQVTPGAFPVIACDVEGAVNYSEDLTADVLTIGLDPKERAPGASSCSEPLQELVPEEPRGFRNLFRRIAPGAPFELVNRAQTEAPPANAQFQDAADDLSRIVFGEDSKLTPEAPPGYDLYLWHSGSLSLVSFLPNGSAVRGDLAGATGHTIGESREGRIIQRLVGGTVTGTGPITHAVSANGERVYFYAQGNLYLRENAAQPPAATPNCLISRGSEPDLACTLQVDAPSRTADPPGGGVFQYASADGSRVFFSDEHKLTSPSSAGRGKPALYEHNVETGTLVDRTVGAADEADVRGFSGAAEDGSRLYFVANGSLTGTQQNGQGEVAESGQPNLYLLEEGALTFIATLDPSSDRSAWGLELRPNPEGGPTGGETPLATRTSPDGRYFAFSSARGLTGGSAGTQQIFVYDALSHTLACASCPPSGGAPSGPSVLPKPIRTTEAEAPAYLPRGLTDQGQLFFTTKQALLPGDRDGVADVYEYRQGQLHLISDGAASGPSYFFDASVGGGDVFFATTDALVRSDTDNALNLYDARVGGGFLEPPVPAPPCGQGEAAAQLCRAANPAARVTSTPATSDVTGPGNLVPGKICKRSMVKRQGRCVKKVKHRRHTRHHSHRRHRGKNKHRAPHSARRGGRR